MAAQPVPLTQLRNFWFVAFTAIALATNEWVWCGGTARYNQRQFRVERGHYEFCWVTKNRCLCLWLWFGDTRRPNRARSYMLLHEIPKSRAKFVCVGGAARFSTWIYFDAFRNKCQWFCVSWFAHRIEQLNRFACGWHQSTATRARGNFLISAYLARILRNYPLSDRHEFILLRSPTSSTFNILTHTAHHSHPSNDINICVYTI